MNSFSKGKITISGNNDTTKKTTTSSANYKKTKQQATDLENPFCIKISADQLMQYDRYQQNGTGKNFDPLNSFTFPNYGTADTTTQTQATNKNSKYSNDENQDDDKDGAGAGVINVATIIGNIGWFQLLVLVFSGLRECSVGYDALITSIMLQPERDFICTSGSIQANGLALGMNGFDDEDDPGLIVGGRRHGGASTSTSSDDTSACSYLPPNATDQSQLETCQSWAFPNHDQNKASLIVEWSLVCDRGYYTALIESSFFMGLVLGNIIWGYLADRIGRKKAYLLSHSIALVAGGLSLIVSEVRLFILFRFMAAIGSIGYNILYTIQMELIGTQHRSYATMFNHLGWGMGAISIPLMASITTNTRIMLSVTPLIALLMLPWAFWLPESSRWLMARGKFSKARKELVRAAKFNGKTIDAKLENLICLLNDKISQDKARHNHSQQDATLQANRQGSPQSKRSLSSSIITSSTNNIDSISNTTHSSRLRTSVNSDDVIIIPNLNNDDDVNQRSKCGASKKPKRDLDETGSQSNSIISSSDSNVSSNISTYRILCSNPKLVRDTIIIAYCSFSGHLFYYLQTINFGDMKNLSIEANFISSGAGEWFSLVVGAISLRYLSRRTCMSICLFIMATSFIFQCMIDSEIVPELDTKFMVTLNNSVGTVASLLLVFVVLIVNQEVYPTVIRQSGSSIGNTLGELGSTLAPWLIQLNRSMGLWRADLLCASMCFAGMIGSQFLTKTDDIELVDI